MEQSTIEAIHQLEESFYDMIQALILDLQGVAFKLQTKEKEEGLNMQELSILDEVNKNLYMFKVLLNEVNENIEMFQSIYQQEK